VLVEVVHGSKEVVEVAHRPPPQTVVVLTALTADFTFAAPSSSSTAATTFETESFKLGNFRVCPISAVDGRSPPGRRSSST
jgi:hypothetical protein